MRRTRIPSRDDLPLAGEPVHLTEVVLTAVDAAHAVEPTRRWSTQIPEVVAIRCNAARLRQAIDNVLANVRTHTPPEAECSISLSIARAIVEAHGGTFAVGHNQPHGLRIRVVLSAREPDGEA
jgi:signal transduction histidine kinase